MTLFSITAIFLISSGKEKRKIKTIIQFHFLGKGQLFKRACNNKTRCDTKRTKLRSETNINSRLKGEGRTKIDTVGDAKGGKRAW